MLKNNEDISCIKYLINLNHTILTCNMKNKLFIFSVSIVSLIIIISLINSSCTNDPVNLDLVDTVCFESQVLPIIQSSCGVTGCHDAGTNEAGFSATNYESIIKLVKSGSPRDSKLYKVITDINGENFMPPSPYTALSKESRTLIMVWIAQGAKNISCKSDTTGQNPNDTTNINPGDTSTYNADSVTFVQDILPIFQSGCVASSCHDAASHEEGYTLDSYAHITAHPGAIVPKYPNNSIIYHVVTNSETDDRMPPPPRNALSSAQIALLQQWISEGALNSDYPEPTCDTANVTFNGSVKPVLQSRCLSCHSNSAAASSGGGIKLEIYSDVKSRADNGSLTGAIKHLNGYSQMPKGSSKLDNCSIRKIEKWIELGSVNN
jgi:hypothetical protein